MKITGFSLQNYRNIELARFEFDLDRPTFLVGSNGQGKSNLLESLGLITAIRSFRTYEFAPLIQTQKRSAQLFFNLIDDQFQETEVEIHLSSRKRSILLDGNEIKRLSEYVGLFPSVVFSAEDTQFIKSGPQLRRRFFDLLFSVVDQDYLVSLQAYHRALKERNNALKSKMDQSVVKAYDRLMAVHGTVLVDKRRNWLNQFLPLFSESYLKIATDEEIGGISYKISLDVETIEAFSDKLESNYLRDSILGSSSVGPHRDDFIFSVKGFPAKSHGSDGQQRCSVLALKLAQIEFIKKVLNRKPIVLLDDILGELDPERKKRFWQAFDDDCQVFASGTSIPSEDLIGQWNVYSVENGNFSHVD